MAKNKFKYDINNIIDTFVSIIRKDKFLNMDNPQLQLAFDFVAYTDKNIFLTGKAGTGKTTFLHSLKKSLPKRMIVVAPTGVAAINAGGVTIHSFFQLPFGPIVPASTTTLNHSKKAGFSGEQDKFHRFNKQKLNIIKSLDLLIIDEISMVRADLLDAIDEVLRRVRRREQPFGGVQVLMIGDLQQLAPVVKDNEWDLLRDYYSTAFFFSSKALTKSEFTAIELTHIYRQNDEKFIKILNRIRTNEPDEETLHELNKRHIPNFQPTDEDGYITLTTHNSQAHTINDAKMKALPGKTFKFKAEIKDEFPEYMYPNDFDLELKIDAQVMFIKNDISQEKLYYNGKIGIISSITDDIIYVNCKDSFEPIPVSPVNWNNTRYSIDEASKEIKETIAGTFTQYPLKAAWAITIHKSQGLTFEKAIIDANASFAHGQVYVALSRCKSLEGLILSSKIATNSIKNDSSIYKFTNEVEQNQPDQERLLNARNEYELKLLVELFDYSIIKSNLSYLLKQIHEHKESFLPNTFRDLDILSNQSLSEIFEVALKFKLQLVQLHHQNPDYSTNLPLKERLRKAAEYFISKTNLYLSEQLHNLDFDCDNKSILKPIDETLERLQNEIQIKLDCLNQSKDNFSISKYLSAKALSILSPVSKKKKSEKKESITPISTSSQTPLFKALREWRKHVADESDQPAFAILHQKTLVTIAEIKPTTIRDLKKIKGIGTRKAQFFGDDIIGIVKQYLFSQNIPIEADTEETAENTRVKTKTEKSKSIHITLGLLNDGKSIEEVAQLRGYTVSTIEGHIAQLITKGLIAIRSVLVEEKIQKIASQIVENPAATIGELKSKLGDEYSWSEIRYVTNHLKVNGLIEENAN